MNIGSATQSNPIPSPPRPIESRPANVESTSSEREPDRDRDDTVEKSQTTPQAPPRAAVGKGVGLLVDVSY
ncbi:MAG: hypothetical protein H6R00_274 [Proteobacteria bacterium]|nr:hypothetical protein [Pseudomonadota bacterium]